ncbi:MAG: tyrosine-type recombinase/integrase [Candidatus Limnocylindria bacterium]
MVSTPAALRAHRTRQIEQRLRAGSAWQDTGYVFTTEVGTPVRASNFMRRHFYPIADRAGIPTRRQPDGSQGVRFHDLRHGCGSLLISLGVKPKIVQTILRHSRLATTMDLYVHAYDEDLREAVNTLDRALDA